MPFIYVSKFANGDSRSQVFPVRVGELRPAMQRVEERKRFDLNTGFVRKRGCHMQQWGDGPEMPAGKVFAPTSLDRVVHMSSWHFHPTAGFLNALKLQNVPSPTLATVPEAQKHGGGGVRVSPVPRIRGIYSAPKVELSE